MISVHQSLLRRVTWAVDAFSEDWDLQKKVAGALQTLTTNMSVTVEPVFVVPPNELFLSPEMVIQPGPSPRQLAEEKMGEFIRTVELPGLIAPTLLDQSETSVRRSAGLLLEYARETRSDLIAAGTHGRHGIDRLLLGSFAESLLLQSEIPTLIVGPDSRVGSRIRDILFPTDFSLVSKEVFEQVVALAAEIPALIILFHKAEAYASYPVLVPEYPHRDLIAHEISHVRKQAEEWAESARLRGVEVETIIDETSAPVAPSIVEMAKDQTADLIVMASQTGPISSVLLGSVTRKVTRSAPCPVWVVHPRKGVAKKKVA